MGCSDVCATLCLLACFLGVSLTLQSVGLFTPKWVTINGTKTLPECHLGLAVSDCDLNIEPNKAVLGLEATSFALILLTTISKIYGLCCRGDETDDNGDGICGWFLCCSVFMYPIAGLLALVGCIISATEYSTSQFGASFYCCNAAGCYIILETVCMCCITCRSLRDDGAIRRSNYGTLTATDVHAIETDQGIFIVARRVTKRLIMHRPSFK